jgi:hypothetical protein
MVRCAYAHGFANPHWEVKENYRRTLSINLGTTIVSLDLSVLDGQLFAIDQLGGHSNWYRIRDVAVQLLSAL